MLATEGKYTFLLPPDSTPFGNAFFHISTKSDTLVQLLLSLCGMVRVCSGRENGAGLEWNGRDKYKC
jgi:hypothetical protein